MASLLPTQASNPISTVIVDLGGTRYALTLAWRPRLYGWYMSLALEDGTPVIDNRRLNPGVGPLWGLISELFPTVSMTTIGPPEYRQNDLGETLNVVVLDAAEIDAIFAGVTVTQPAVRIV